MAVDFSDTGVDFSDAGVALDHWEEAGPAL
jgi:hypothetical protein